jgi:hypothetical protein
MPHERPLPGLQTPWLSQTPDQVQSFPHVSVPQEPQLRVSPGRQLPCPSQTPDQPQPEPALQCSTPQRPQARVAPPAHAPSPLQLLQLHVAEQLRVPQLPHGSEAPGLHSPSRRHVPLQAHVAEQTSTPQFPQLRTSPAWHTPSFPQEPQVQELVQVRRPHRPQFSEVPGAQPPGTHSEASACESGSFTDGPSPAGPSPAASYEPSNPPSIVPPALPAEPSVPAIRPPFAWSSCRSPRSAGASPSPEPPSSAMEASSRCAVECDRHSRQPAVRRSAKQSPSGPIARSCRDPDIPRAAYKGGLEVERDFWEPRPSA